MGCGWTRWRRDTEREVRWQISNALSSARVEGQFSIAVDSSNPGLANSWQHSMSSSPQHNLRRLTLMQARCDGSDRDRRCTPPRQLPRRRQQLPVPLYPRIGLTRALRSPLWNRA